jgi:hypothetical protein
MESKADDLSPDTEELPQPGTDEPATPPTREDDESTAGPGNVSIDEPTDTVMSPKQADHKE